jgi:hypothetical protein
MVRKRSSITLSIAEQEKAQLEAIALAFDQTWGDKPNISKLLKAIAKGKLRLAKNHDWQRDRLDTLNKALNHLKDGGYFDEASELANVLLERSELSRPLREEIQDWLDAPGLPWRFQLEQCLQRHRPFRLAYQDATGRIWRFTIRHAKIERHEDRLYIDCWCDETEGNQDVEALKHNWSFRLDRIPNEALISPVDGFWEPELSYVDIEFHLLNRLADTYRSKTEADLSNQLLVNEGVRQIVRRVRNTFWFFREIRRYGADCMIVGPQDVRDRFVCDLEETIQNYK